MRPKAQYMIFLRTKKDYIFEKILGPSIFIWGNRKMLNYFFNFAIFRLYNFTRKASKIQKLFFVIFFEQ